MPDPTMVFIVAGKSAGKWDTQELQMSRTADPGGMAPA
jgi:hypothetical protein